MAPPPSSDSDGSDAEAFANKVLASMGPTETLLMSMRLVLLVGQRAPEDPEVVQAAGEALAAIKRVGALTGVLLPG